MNNKTPKNQEHFEAVQAEANKIKAEILAKSSERTKELFKIVEGAVEEMTKAGIPFYLYASLPNANYDNKEMTWQYNSLVALAEFDEAGKFTPEWSKRASLCEAGMFSNQYYTITNYFLDEKVESAEKWQFFGRYLNDHLINYSRYCHSTEEGGAVNVIKK